MRLLAGALLPALLLGAGACGYFWLNRVDGAAGSAPPLAGAPVTAQVLARGEYLTKAADCVACHTVPGSGEAYAGGVAFRLPFGTLYSTNITADPDNGIGGWSDAAFVAAVREGVRRDGAHLYPAFPYTSYTQLSRDDVLAIKAYLFAQPVSRRRNKANQLVFPFNQRWAMGFWNAAFFKSSRFTANVAKSPEWNRGAYLATALGHCAECHTPRNWGFGLEHDNEFAGQELQGWLAYNITADARYGIGAWSDEDVVRYLRTGHADGHASAAGPMGEAVAMSLQYLAAPDTAALVTYLRSVPARVGRQALLVDARPAGAAASGAAASGADSLGGRLFAGNCASCHQGDGQGRQTPYAALAGTRGVVDPQGVNVSQVILQGAQLRIGDTDVYMPAFAAAYSNTEVAALTDYVLAHFGATLGKVTPEQVAERRKR